MRIDCGGFDLRSARANDASDLAQLADNPRIAANLRDYFPHPYGLEDAEEWLETVRAEDPETKFVIDLAGELAGVVGLELGHDVYRHSAEVGYWVGEPYWGRGIATAAVRAITRWGFRELDLTRIHAYVFERNAGSWRVLEKAGFELEGTMRRAVIKNGRAMDQLVFARLREDDPC